ncbi:vanadium-dependent haloperoxidase [Natrialbaceae archaeon A-CW3]
MNRRRFLGSVALPGIVGGSGCTRLGGHIDDDEGMVVEWNERFVEAIQAFEGGNVGPVRWAALLNVAIFEAVNSITAARGDPHYEAYAVDGTNAPVDGSRPAAVTGAAFTITERGYGQPYFAEIRDESFERAREDDGDLRDGFNWGVQVAEQILDTRPYDQTFVDEPYQACDNPADAPGCFRGSWLPEFAFVPPWTLDDPAQFRPEGAPALDSNVYAKAWNEVYEYGRDRPNRSVSEVEQAAFWRSTRGSPRVPGMWNTIAQTVADNEDLSIVENARMFALLSLVLADAGISCWEAKYMFGFWRPRTAIRDADRDGNPDTELDSDWEPLSVGGSPEYSAGLATYSGAAARILTDIIGTDEYVFEFGESLTTGLDADETGVSRSYDGFQHAVRDAIDSRIFLGNHFRFALEDGAAKGDELATWVLDTHLRPIE